MRFYVYDCLARFLSILRVFHVNACFDVLKLYAVVHGHGLELRERFIDQVAHGCVWEEGDFVVSFYHDWLSAVHIDACTLFDRSHLERSKSFDFHDLFLMKSVEQHINQRIQERRHFLFRLIVALSNNLCQILNLNHSSSLLSSTSP